MKLGCNLDLYAHTAAISTTTHGSGTLAPDWMAIRMDASATDAEVSSTASAL